MAATKKVPRNTKTIGTRHKTGDKKVMSRGSGGLHMAFNVRSWMLGILSYCYITRRGFADEGKECLLKSFEITMSTDSGLLLAVFRPVAEVSVTDHAARASTSAVPVPIPSPCSNTPTETRCQLV